MPSARHGRPPLSVPLPPNSHQSTADLPPIDALFLIDFDVKKGYTIAWRRTGPGLEIDGRVEYKSLPSGLHTVTDDLIYFVHDDAHAGLSAFVNTPCDEEEARNARMIAVGVLVPLSYGRLGRAWRHAQGLKDLAAKLARDRNDTEALEQYWDSRKAEKDVAPASLPLPTGETPLASPAVTFLTEPATSTSDDTPQTPPPAAARKGHARKRSASDGISLNHGTSSHNKLSPYHPAWSLTTLLDRFGPLIFPIHRAALLRKRILISCHAPVHEACNFVYNLSVLSNIPLSLANVLPESSPTHRLRPLFTIGVHDLPFLTEDYEAAKRREESDSAIHDDEENSEAGSGWVACTTDSILAMKDTLWDMLITMPPEHAVRAKERAWPTVECPRGQPVKATQRDVRRFNALRNGLTRLAATAPLTPNADAFATGADTSPHRPPSSSTQRSESRHGAADEAFDRIAEPLSWTALAYNGYMWWASAGEQLRSEEQEESTRDAALLAGVLGPSPQTPMSASIPDAASSRPDLLGDSLASLTPHRGAGGGLGGGDGEARIELAIIAYFHRLTTQMISILADVVDSADESYPSSADDDDDNDDRDDGDDGALLPGPDDLGQAVTVDSRSVENMGLDVWSASDDAFVQDLMRTYFGRVARIEGKGIEVCGVRVC